MNWRCLSKLTDKETNLHVARWEGLYFEVQRTLLITVTVEVRILFLWRVQEK